MYKATTCQKVVLLLMLSQIIIIVIGYYGNGLLWTVMSHKHMTNGLVTPASMRNDFRSTSNASVDIHLMNADQEHGFQHQSVGGNVLSVNGSVYKASIAIGLGITTRKLTHLTGPGIVKMPFFKSLLTSFCQTASAGYDYQFFVAYDYNDVHLSKQDFQNEFGKEFSRFTQIKCPMSSRYSLHYVQCSHTGKPAWAQNDAMIEAYMSGVDYFYRINDDTTMTSAKWTEKFIETLEAFIPARLGVVGPKHKGGNTVILTYDFTHRTHVEIHGFYYPREFPDWYGDRWVTEVYKPGRSIKRSDVLLVHTMETGQRYRNTHRSAQQIGQVVARDKYTVSRYVKMAESGFVQPEADHVIAMTLSDGSAANSWGVVRNAQLVRVIYPGWSLHVYTSNTSAASDHVIRTLASLGVNIIYVDQDAAKVVPPELWHYLAVDNQQTKILLLREASHRLTERDYATVTHWLKSDSPSATIHSIKDHPTHAAQHIVHGLWGARTDALRALPGYTNMVSLYRDYRSRQSSSKAGEIASTFLHEALYPIFKEHIVCYDSLNCDKNNGSRPFPVDRNQPVYVGQAFDSHEAPLLDEKLNLLQIRSINCEGLS